VVVIIFVPGWAREMQVSPFADFRGTSWKRVSSRLTVDIPAGGMVGRIHVKFRGGGRSARLTVTVRRR
jgi:hypothetical protein